MVDDPNQYPEFPGDPAPSSWLAQNRRFVILGGGVIGVALILVIVWQIRQAPNVPSNANLSTNTAANVSSTTNRQPSTFRRYTVTTHPDQDRDGLTDAEEEQLGTNPAQADSDGDGLSDYDEAKIYHTNPLKTDSDGDGLTDGQEVHQGTNPSGPGSLLNINQALQHLTNK